MGFIERGIFGSKKTVVGNLLDPFGLFPFDKRASKQKGAASITSAVPPSVADDSGSKRKRRAGRNALILTNQENILEAETDTSRNRLVAF